MTRILRIPANSQAYLTAMRDSAQDKFDVVDYVFPYLNAMDFPAAWAYWKMDESSGTRADATGNGHHLPQSGSPGYDTGKIGNAVISSSNSDGLRLEEIAWPVTGNFMIAMWIKIAADGGVDFNSNMGIWAEAIGSNWYMYAATDACFAESAYIYSLDEWHFICVYHDGVGLYIEIDGVEAASDLGAHGITDPYGVTYIYGLPAGQASWDEVGIWVGDNATAAIARRAELYNGGAGWSPY